MNLIIIARHYSKLLLRNRLFQVYYLITFASIIYIQIHNQSNLPKYSISGLASLSSFIPYMNAYLFTLLQTILLLFLASGFLNRERKIDSMDAIFYRPESNTEYIWGMSLAFIFTFFIMAIISQVLAMLIHLFASEAPFNFGVYLFYLFTLILPSIIFTLGFSMFIVNLIKYRALSLVILLGTMFILNFYINDFQQGILNPLGLSLPNAFSGITGHPDLINYLLQRGCWLLLGVGFIQWTILNFSRIPNLPGRVKSLKWALVCTIVGVSFGCIAFSNHQSDLSLRRKYISTYEKYAPAKHGTLVQENINYQQHGNKMAVKAEMIIKNETQENLEQVILYLNPFLKITSIERDGEKISYKREHQVILIEKNIPVGQNFKITVHYNGKIDENICYPDIPEKSFSDTRDRSYLTCRYGKHHAFLDSDYTLLIPEVLWYPVTIPPVNLQSTYNTPKNFTRYTLKVIQPGEKTVITQGKRLSAGDTLVFQDKSPLPGISLCMGNYERRTIDMDSTRYELNLFSDHVSLLDNMKWLNNRSALLELLSDLIEDAKDKTGKNYPYDHFILTETPITFTSYFRNEQGGSGYVQPEIVFLPERGIGIWREFKYMTSADIKRTLQSILFNTSIMEELFSFNKFLGLPYTSIKSLMLDIQGKENPYMITPLFYNYMISIQSCDYPIMNQVLGLISLSNKNKGRQKESTDKKFENRATRYLTQSSLKDALGDKKLTMEEINKILQLKSKDLVTRFQVKGINSDSLISFIDNFLKDHKFQLVDFTRFNQLFIEQFGMDGNDILASWFTQNQLPRYLIKNFSAQVIKEKTIELGYPVTRVEFSVFNDSPQDGIITIQISDASPSGAKAGLSSTKGPEFEELVPSEYNYMIPAGTGQKVAFIQHRCPSYITLNTNLSENIPNSKTLRSHRGLPGISTSPITQAIDKNYFLEQPGEVIVDNEDSGFKILQPSSTNKVQVFLNKHQAIEEKYGNLVSIMTVNESWKFYVDDKAFGRTIQSAVIRKAGKGESSVEWNVTINKEGEYEVYVYLPNTSFTINNSFLVTARNSESMADTQIYQVFSGKGKKEIVINTYNQEGWISLGCFHFPTGEYKVSLSDQGQPEQLIVADAVKWEYCNK